ncbi:YolD-like family protein [Alteribacter aurantiacus]|uniref:YolD-like family protein n=1 Tax=Alteribacter aurantiacus TaxID=254410 RepID=UPI00041A0154|nr:YolD-like family protein [Alteribacter aurantiacus]
MFQDRGVIKWTSMMLPEHVRELKRLKEEYEKDTIPTLDPQTLEEWNLTLKSAQAKGLAVLVTYVKEDRKQSTIGVVRRFDRNHLYLSSGSLRFDSILHIENEG